MKTKFNGLELTKEDWDIIVEGVENLKHKDIAGDMMSMILEGLLAPEKNASPEVRAKWEDGKKLQAMEKQLKEDEKRKFVAKLELLKAKLVLIGAENKELNEKSI